MSQCVSAGSGFLASAALHGVLATAQNANDGPRLGDVCAPDTPKSGPVSDVLASAAASSAVAFAASVGAALPVYDLPSIAAVRLVAGATKPSLAAPNGAVATVASVPDGPSKLAGSVPNAN